MKAYVYYDDLGKDIRVEEIPDDMKEKAEEYRASLMEHVAEQDDALMEKYFADEEITIDEIKACIRKSTIANTMVPVVCGTSYKNKGVQKLLDAIVDYMPSPTGRTVYQGYESGNWRRRHSVILLIQNRSQLWHLRSQQTRSLVSCASSVYILVPLTQVLPCCNATKDNRERMGRILQMHANHRKDIETVYAW